MRPLWTKLVHRRTVAREWKKRCDGPIRKKTTRPAAPDKQSSDEESATWSIGTHPFSDTSSVEYKDICSFHFMKKSAAQEQELDALQPGVVAASFEESLAPSQLTKSKTIQTLIHSQSPPTVVESLVEDRPILQESKGSQTRQHPKSRKADFSKKSPTGNAKISRKNCEEWVAKNDSIETLVVLDAGASSAVEAFSGKKKELATTVILAPAATVTEAQMRPRSVFVPVLDGAATLADSITSGGDDDDDSTLTDSLPFEEDAPSLQTTPSVISGTIAQYSLPHDDDGMSDSDSSSEEASVSILEVEEEDDFDDESTKIDPHLPGLVICVPFKGTIDEAPGACHIKKPREEDNHDACRTKTKRSRLSGGGDDNEDEDSLTAQSQCSDSSWLLLWKAVRNGTFDWRS